MNPVFEAVLFLATFGWLSYLTWFKESEPGPRGVRGEAGEIGAQGETGERGPAGTSAKRKA